MNKRLIIVLSAFAFITSCGKENVYTNNLFSSAIFINAAPGVSGSLPQPGLHIFIDTFQKTASTIPYRGSSGYLPASPGTRLIQVRSSIDLKKNFVDLASETVASNKAFTYLIYDTISTTNQILKVLKLDDDLSVPEPGFVKFRFINAAVRSTPLDVTFVRTSVMPNDSVTVLNQSYIGSSPASSALSPFSTKLPTGAYSIRLKAAGTQTLLVTASTITFTPFQRYYTFFATGTAVTLPLSVGAVLNY